jgi:hypothetical protein
LGKQENETGIYLNELDVRKPVVEYWNLLQKITEKLRLVSPL